MGDHLKSKKQVRSVFYRFYEPFFLQVGIPFVNHSSLQVKFIAGEKIPIFVQNGFNIFFRSYKSSEKLCSVFCWYFHKFALYLMVV